VLEADHHHTMITRAHTCVVVEVEVVVVDDQTVERLPSGPAVVIELLTHQHVVEGLAQIFVHVG
jgi:hypothetical protein